MIQYYPSNIFKNISIEGLFGKPSPGIYFKRNHTPEFFK